MKLIPKARTSLESKLYSKFKKIRKDYDTVHALKCQIDGIVYNYAYIYVKNKKIIYLSVGESYISSDGDYKRNFIRWIPFNKKDQEIIDFFESYTMDKLTGGMQLMAPKFIENKRIDVEIFTLSFIYFGIFQLTWPVMNNHVNQMYEQLYDIKKFEKLYIEAKKLYTNKNIIAIIMPRNKIFTGSIDFRFGQKLIPLFLKDVCDVNFIANAWKEIYISQFTNSLILHNHGNFSYTIDWDILTGIDDPKSFLSNYYLIDQMYDNKRTKDTLAKIEKWKKMEGISNISKFIQKEDKLGEIYDGDYITLIASWVGMPYYSYLKTDLETELKKKAFRGINPLLNSNDFVRTWFDLIYNLHNLNSQHIIHGDLHLNNFTIYAPPERCSGVETAYKGYKIAYRSLQSHDKYYVFDHKLYYTYIIDFSRAILGKGHYMSRNYKDFQDSYILEIFERYFPTLYSENKPALMSLIDDEEFFKVLCAFDIYSASLACIAFMVNEHPPNSDTNVGTSNFYAAVIKQELPKKYKDRLMNQFNFIVKLNEFAKDFIIDNTTMMIKKIKVDIQWPSVLAFRLFDEFLKDKDDDIDLLDKLDISPIDEVHKLFNPHMIDQDFMKGLQEKKCNSMYRDEMLSR